MLARHPHKDEGAIFYNQDIAHKGRTNFTLAHELGHYFVHWSKSNNRAFRSGKYYATRKECIEIPNGSLAFEARYTPHARNGVKHKAGIWFQNTEVTEFSIFSTEHEKTLTVLILEDSSGYRMENDPEEGEELLVDTATQISKNFRKGESDI